MKEPYASANEAYESANELYTFANQAENPQMRPVNPHISPFNPQMSPVKLQMRRICSINPKIRPALTTSLQTCLKDVTERWGAGVETQKNVRGEIGGWGRVPFNETYAPSLSTIYDGA